MAERKLQVLLDKILDKTRKDGMKQSDRNITDTLITFQGIDDILLSWYENQYIFSTQGFGIKSKRMGKYRGQAQANIKKDWNKLMPQRRGAYEAYKTAVRNAIEQKNYGVQLVSNPDHFVWRFYPFGKKITAEQAHSNVNKSAMAAMALYVDNNWTQAEQKIRGKSYINNPAAGRGNVRGSLSSMASNFSHGRYADQSSPGSPEYGSTTPSIGVLEDIIRGDLRKNFKASNPVVDYFIEDIFKMFKTDGSIELVDASTIGGHKNTIIIKGAVTSKRINQTKYKSWDRGKKIDPSINQRLNQVLQRTFANLASEIEKKGTLAGFDWKDIEGSPKQTEIVTDKAVRTVMKEIKKANPSAKLTYAKKKIKQKKRTTATSTNKKGKSTEKKKSGKRAKAPVAARVKGQSRARVSAAMSPIGLTALLNKTLGDQVKKNMGPYPRRLENRTGRFAGSAEVTNVAVLPKSVEIQYTYQKDPYAVFEPQYGNELASYGRDPKRIIGGTIREIAQSIMGQKFGLVRTKRV